MASKNERPVATKRPTGGRPQLQSRLISSESTSTGSSGSATDLSRIPSQSSTVDLNDRLHKLTTSQESLDGSSGAALFVNGPLVHSPGIEERPSIRYKEPSQSSVSASVSSQPTPRPPKPSYSRPRPVPISALTPPPTIPGVVLDNSPPNPTPSTRWANLRDVVLPGRSVTPTSHHAQQSTTSSTQSAYHTAQSSQSSATPSRPTTPKPNRFPRFPFRQVVDHVGAQMSTSSSSSSMTHKFSDEVLHACNAARFSTSGIAPGKHGKGETTVGSNFLPFANPNPLQPIRRPQSQHSLTTVASKIGTKPTLQHLYTTLLLQSQAQGQHQHQYVRLGVLPHEMLVLSALLCPFVADVGMGNEMDGSVVGEEMLLSLEIFGVIVKAWPSVTPESSVARIIHLIKAALPNTPLRPKLLSILSPLMLQSSSPNALYTPIHLQTMFLGLFTLLSSLSLSGASEIETGAVRNIIAQFHPDLNKSSFQTDYGVAFEERSSGDNMQALSDGIMLDSLGKAMDNSGEFMGRYILRNLIEEYWPIQDPSPTPLMSALRTRAINTYTRAFLSILSPPSTTVGVPDESDSILSAAFATDAEIRLSAHNIRHLLSAFLIPSVTTDECMPGVVRVVLEMLCIDTTCTWAFEQLVHWWLDEKWQGGVQIGLQKLITESGWSASVRVLSALVEEMPEDYSYIVKALISYFIPVLHSHLASNSPPEPPQFLAKFMTTLSYAHPQAFFKPLVSLAKSTDEKSARQHLATLLEINRFVPDWWRRDAEMMSVIIMSETGGQQGKPRLGQSLLVTEVILRLRETRLGKDEGSDKKVQKGAGVEKEKDRSFMETAKFVTALETRLGILLDAKEKNTPVPSSQRRLFSVLFLEMRLFTRSLKGANFLPLIVSWFLDLRNHQQNSSSSSADADDEDELYESTRQLSEVYTSVLDIGADQHRSTLLSPNVRATSPPNANVTRNPLTSLSESGRKFIESIVTTQTQEIAPQFLELLVALSGLLTADDYKQMGWLLWRRCLDGTEIRVLAPACFLVMQCAEKTENILLGIVKDDLQSQDTEMKNLAMRRISTLVNWRFQILSQSFIVDRAHRRPFKLTRGPLPFIATDMGSPSYVREEDTNTYPAHLYQKKAKETTNANDRAGSAGEIRKANTNLPLELRKRLAEIGWAQEETAVDEKLEWILTPISLLPIYELDRGMVAIDPGSPSPALSPKKPLDDAGDGMTSLLRRKSSTGGSAYGSKKRAVFVPSLAAVFPVLASLVFDSQFTVASVARSTIMDIMRNDPGLLTRPIFDLLAGNQNDMTLAISTLRAFFHVRQVLPPGMAHHVFNNLAGFLKFVARQTEDTDTLKSFAHTVPILSKLVTQVSEMSIREIRRAKIEVFLIPSGSLWFSSSAPPGPMFPQQLGPSDNISQPVPPTLVGITMIRLAQNMTFLAMLKRKPQDVQMIRKSMSRLVLPFRELNKADSTPLELKDYIPRPTIAERERINPFTFDGGLRGLSLMLSRSYLLLIAQMFRSMSRHLNDRNELAVLVDGLNRILLVHGDDIGVVSHAMIALMVASTRFRRLFISGGGYTLFMPMVIKVYSESEKHDGIRLAIEYAVNRFYALHREAFVFQTLDIVAHVMMVPDIDGDWIAKNVYTLFSVLGKGISPSTPDAAGIHDANKMQEREALIMTTAEEKPQTFLASLGSLESGNDYFTVDVPEEYESERFGIDNFVRLFLTVIAHDPTILRAEQFLRFLRFLSPHLYHASASARAILREGIDALGVILTRTISKTKNPDTSILKPVTDYSVDVLATEAVLENQLLDKSKSPSDVLGMRMDYLSLIVAFTRVGGHLEKETSQRAFELFKIMLRDSSADNSGQIGSLLTAYVRNSLLRDARPSTKEVLMVLTDFLPLLRIYAIGVDFSGVLETISELAAKSHYANDETFSRLVVTQICAAGLAACEVAASEKILLKFPLRTRLVSLLANAVCLRGADMIAEVEKQAPTYEFLTGIVLPLVMAMKTTSEVVSEGKWTEDWHRTVHARTWVRLLSYILSACSKREAAREGVSVPERTKSQEKRHSSRSHKSHIATVVTAIEVLKAIIIRAEDDLSSYLPGVWSRIAILLKSILEEGNGNFAFTPKDYSPSPSPSHSPKASLSYYGQSSPISGSANFGTPSFHVTGGPTLHPRLVDYSMWSLFELLCLNRNALMIQMRIFVQEKVATLHEDLRSQAIPGTTSRDGRISSIFSKPRRRMSAMPSSVPNSPGLSVSQSSPVKAVAHDVVRQPGYQHLRYSQGSSKELHGVPKIVHLGPVQNVSATGLSPGGNVRAMRASARVKSSSLVRATYERIRLVMFCMGFEHSLLPPVAGERKLDDTGITWTKKQALQAVMKEMKDLMEEFNETFLEESDDMVMVDVNQSMSF